MRKLELEFMTILAEQIINRAQENEAAYIRENCNFTVYDDSVGIITIIEVVCHIQAQEDGLSEVEAVAEYISDRSSGVVDIVPILGCRLRSLKDNPDRQGQVTAKLALPAPLAEGCVTATPFKL